MHTRNTGSFIPKSPSESQDSPLQNHLHKICVSCHLSSFRREDRGQKDLTLLHSVEISQTDSFFLNDFQVKKECRRTRGSLIRIIILQLLLINKGKGLYFFEILQQTTEEQGLRSRFTNLYISTIQQGLSQKSISVPGEKLLPLAN